jgi:hypothetical protein
LCYEYQVDQSSDVTPLSENLLESAVNAYIADSSIVNNLILAVYEIDNDTWYAKNHNIAAA